MKTPIAYYRVSTDRQDRSGLGLEAQPEAVRLFADRQGFLVTAHFTEIEKEKQTSAVPLQHSPNAGKKQPRSSLPSSTD